MGLEGIVSKRRDRPHKAGRSKHWVKMKNRQHSAMSRVREAFGCCPRQLGKGRSDPGKPPRQPRGW